MRTTLNAATLVLAVILATVASDTTSTSPTSIAALAQEDIHQALRRHLDLDKLSVFRSGDSANKLPKTDSKWKRAGTERI